MKCDRCANVSIGYELLDYCAECSRNLCGSCFSDGCCGKKPAESGSEKDDTPPCDECGRLMGHKAGCSKKAKRDS